MRDRAPRRGRGALLAAGALALAAALLTGCTDDPAGKGSPDPTHDPTRSTGAPRTLRVLASSELSDMAPILDAAAKATGITVKPTWTGTVEAVDRLASGAADKAYDAVWLSSSDHLRLRPEAARKVASETPVMTSPVAIGVKPAVVARLGWQPEKVTWADVHRAVAADRLTYGMTDPERSNSGFAALVSVASALSGAQSALSDADVRTASPRLKEFFAGQRLTSGSSGWLATAYARRGDVDALINYESVLHSMNRDAAAKGGSTPPLTVVRPRDGVITADYPLAPLTAAAPAARDALRDLTGYLRTPAAQRQITERTLRRPVVTSVPPAPALAAGQRRELPFPGSRAVADGLLDAYQNKLRRPSRTVYVLDTSGSMAGERLTRLKAALTQLTGDFREREQVTLLPFGSKVKRAVTHTAAPASLRSAAAALSASGETAIYSSLEAAYGHIGDAGTGAFTSIVLMTDGENTTGASAADFDAFYAGLPADRRTTPVFPVVFGDSDRAELTHIAQLTGGRLFDATKGSLDGAFEEIRGYQ
ncbi:substrate-binding domain-containing protein [Streptomyces sp. NPDC050504]|uniref:substrate-binding domain-containing protein n=1 Tax=Streptomyces sp. NPDC050504 TaxID=3365618 RepID=UPI00378DAD07